MTSRKNDDQQEPMHDYLWDRSGTPDPEIQRLESLLSEFRHEERPLVLAAQLSSENRSAFRSFVQKWAWFHSLRGLAAAAVVLLLLSLGGLFVLHRTNPSVDTTSVWNVNNLHGAPQIGTETVSGDRGYTAKLRVGQTLTTDSTSRASLYQTDLGEIQVDPNSRLRLIQSGPDRKRIQLEVGTIHAAIWAPPAQFVVDTPSAVAVDLGCRYTLQVAPDGSGTIRTTLGWVGFHLNGRDSFIPAGAMCSTRPEVGPGIPYFEDASPSFRAAVDAFNSAPLPASDANSRQIQIILHQARAKDGLTLWHLLFRTAGDERSRVYERLALLVPPPPGVTCDGVLQLNAQMLDLYWNAMNLGDISVWRFWEQSSNPSSSQHPGTLQNKQVLVKKSTNR
jgi:FecR protein